MSFFLLFLYTYANFLIKNGQVEDIEGKEQCVLRTHSIRNKRETRADERRGGSRWVSLLTDWVSDSEPVPFFYSNKCVSLLADIHRPSKPKAREGRQVNEGKSIAKRF